MPSHRTTDASAPSPPPFDEQSLAQQAAAWVVVQEGPEWPQHRAAFAQWLQASPLHRTAYTQAHQSWQLARALRDMPQLLAQLAPDTVDEALRPPVAEAQQRSPAHAWTRRQSVPRVARGNTEVAVASGAWARRVRRVSLMVALSVVVLVGGLLTWSQGDPYTAIVADYRSAAGQLRDITLPDGSAVRLDAASAIAVHYDDRLRRIELLKGRALFIAAPVQAPAAGGRPFVVATADGQTRALGTQFIVERLEEQTIVTGVEHRIAVNATATPSLTPVILEPGQSVRYDAHGLRQIHTVPLTQARAWEEGMLLFDDMPLHEVLAQLERYKSGRILLQNAELAQRHISAAVPATDVDAGLQTIASELGLRVMRLPLVTLLY